METRPRYRTFVADSARWDGFELRADDIVISTPPKCGTTWMQMICALLVFQTPKLERPLTSLSPWLDMQTNKLDDVRANLEEQRHRRFIKTHTPYDGLPHDQRVTYICVGRDPRDVGFSWDNHMLNLDFANFVTARAAAVGMDDVGDFKLPTEPPPPDPVERFRLWLESEDPPTENIGTLRGTVHHLDTFWQRREEPNTELFHYADLCTDLRGEMQRLAGALGIDVADDRWDELVEAATFDRMAERADELAPDVNNAIWQDNRRFFDRGRKGQWRELLTDDDLNRYDERVRTLASDDLARWLHEGRAAIG